MEMGVSALCSAVAVSGQTEWLVTGVSSLALGGWRETRLLCGEEVEYYQLINVAESRADSHSKICFIGP